MLPTRHNIQQYGPNMELYILLLLLALVIVVVVVVVVVDVHIGGGLRADDLK